MTRNDGTPSVQAGRPATRLRATAAALESDLRLAPPTVAPGTLAARAAALETDFQVLRDALDALPETN